MAMGGGGGGSARGTPRRREVGGEHPDSRVAAPAPPSPYTAQARGGLNPRRARHVVCDCACGSDRFRGSAGAECAFAAAHPVGACDTWWVLGGCRRTCATSRSRRAPQASASFEARADTLLAELTLEEKVSQLDTDSPAIDRVGIPAFNWWQECLHGAMLWETPAGGATMFPQPLALAATFDRQLAYEVASMVADELRAQSNSLFDETGSPQ